MIDFSPMRDGDLTFIEYAQRENVDADALKRCSDESVDFLLGLLEDLTNDDIVFDPEDLSADDPYAVEGEENIGWTLGHLIAHVTASSEEGAAFSSLLARGVPASERPRLRDALARDEDSGASPAAAARKPAHAQRLPGNMARRTFD